MCHYHANDDHAPVMGPIPFEVELIQGWFGRLSGILCDEILPGEPEEMPLTGTIQNQKIQLTMHRPLRLRHTECSQSIDDYITQSTGKKLDEPVAPLEIRFTGALSADANSMQGSWFVLHTPVRFRSGGTWYCFDLGGSVTTGTWVLRRVIA
jgi:hypothetical protein